MSGKPKDVLLSPQLLDFPPQTFIKRQQKVFSKMKEPSLLIVSSPPPARRNWDVDFRYRPSSDVLWLTGVEDPQTCVVLLKKDDKESVFVFLPKIKEDKAVWIGKETPEDVILSRGVEKVFPLEELEKFLEENLPNLSELYFHFEDENIKELLFKKIKKFKLALRDRKGVPKNLKDASEILWKLRAVKDEREIEVIRQAVKITSKALLSLEIKEGMWEWEIDAQLLSFYRRFGGWEAFPSIVASGPNATVLHYMTNSGPVRRGITLIDTGVEWRWYSSDITRPFLIKPTGFERELVEAVRSVQEKVIGSIKAGVSFAELNEIAGKEIASALKQFGFLKDGDDKEKLKKFYPHRIGHHLGLDVHDQCLYFDSGEPIPLEEGAVITVEPGIYISPSSDDVPEWAKGVGVRIEDDVFVKKDGAEVLSAELPKFFDVE